MNLNNLSRRDRQSLIVLVVFLSCAVYYQFLFEPVYGKWKTASQSLAKQRKELMTVERKIRERGSLERDLMSLGSAGSALTTRRSMPPVGEDLSARVKAIMQAARDAGLRVGNLRPAASAEAQVVDSFALEALGSHEQIVTFLDSIWGLEVQELNITSQSDPGSPLRVYLRLRSLPVWEVDLPDEVKPGKMSAFHLEANPFVPKTPPVAVGSPPPIPAPVIRQPEPEDIPKEEGIAGLQLVGVMSSGSRASAVITDTASGEDLFVGLGASVKSYKVEAIDENSVVLSSGSDRKKLTLPEAQFKAFPGQQRPVGEAAASSADAGRSARLGLNVKVMDDELARSKGLVSKRGLLVTSGRPDAPQVVSGDVIMSINGIDVESIERVRKILLTLKPGDDVEMGIVRDGVDMSVKYKVIE